MTLKEYINSVLELSKVKITVAVALTTITGYVLGNGKADMQLAGVVSGIFLLACGSSVLNQIQEFRTDSMMERTHNRPIPSGKIGVRHALIIALVEIAAGVFILLDFVNTMALILGLTALVWYNAIYTPLKKLTPHAVIPGSVIGAIPPLAGWVAAGRSVTDPEAWAMAFFFFIWQVPHFYLLALKFGPQYEDAGFPTIRQRYSVRNQRWLIFLWVVLTAAVASSLYFFGVIRSAAALLLISLSSVWLIIVFMVPVFKAPADFRPIRYFVRLNLYVLFVIMVLNVDRLFTVWF